MDFDFGRVLRRGWRRSGRRVESDQADGAKFGVGTELALRRVPVAGQVVIVRGADQLDKDDQRRRKDRGDRARPASGGFGSADQNRSSGRLLGPDCYSQRSRGARPAVLGRHRYAPCYSQEYAGLVNIY